MTDRIPDFVPDERPAASTRSPRWRPWIWRCAFLALLIALTSPLSLPTAWGQRSEPKKKPAAEADESQSSKESQSRKEGQDEADAPSPSDADEEPEAQEPAADDAPAEQRFSRQEMLIASLTIFVLAVFVGFEVITKVPPTLHTPLMSGSNAISGITIVGALIVSGRGLWFAPVLGFIAVVLATVNVVGGFLVTHRMLAMFKKR